MSHNSNDQQYDNLDEEDGEEAWDLISHEEAPEEDVNPPITPNAYLQFQLDTRLGRLSFEVKPTAPGPHGINISASHTTTATVIEYGTRSINPQASSPLFRHLPAEIRLQIYELVLYIPPLAGKTCTLLAPALKNQLTPSVLTLLQTCRLVRREAEKIFYRINRLCFDPYRAFWRNVNVRRREAITKFELPPGNAAQIYADLQILRKEAPQVRSLYLRRNLSVLFTYVKSWAILAKQISTELERMEKLVELRIFMPEAKNLGEADLERQKKLNAIDEGFYEVIRRRNAVKQES